MKVEGTIHVSYTCECPHCDEYHDTDRDQDFAKAISNANEYWRVDHDDRTDNLEVECINCKKTFIVEKFTHLY